MAGAVVITAGLALLSMRLGSWAYKTRRDLIHERRLERLLEKKPIETQVMAGLAQEGAQDLGVARHPDELRALAKRAGPKAGTVAREGTRWPTTRLVTVGGVLYFLYFDERGTMTGFTLVAD
jgi:hypothetical protein